LSKLASKLEFTNRSNRKNKTPRLSGLLKEMSSIFSLSKMKDESYLAELPEFLKSDKNLKSDTSSFLKEMILNSGGDVKKREKKIKNAWN
jgi:hypothetical protein